MATSLLIAFYSRNGSTEALAQSIAEGARTEHAGCGGAEGSANHPDQELKEAHRWTAS